LSAYFRDNIEALHVTDRFIPFVQGKAANDLLALFRKQGAAVRRSIITRKVLKLRGEILEA